MLYKQIMLHWNVAQETEEDGEAEDFYELLDKKDDVFAFDIFDDITHYDLSEPDTDNDSKSFEETNFSGQQNHSISCYDAYFIS